MTRVNAVPVSWLIDQHLVAEYREIPRVRPAALRWARLGRPGPPPSERYVLGPGHVRFFYVRLGWLAARHRALVAEMRDRGFAVNLPPLEPPPPGVLPDLPWDPPSTAALVCVARLEARTREMTRPPRYRGDVVGRDHYGGMPFRYVLPTRGDLCP